MTRSRTLLHFLLTLTLTAQCLALQLLWGERHYSPEPLAALYHTPSRVSVATVEALLDVLEQYGLTQWYGIYALHTHLRVGEGEVLYLSQAPEGNFTSLTSLPYARVFSTSIPLTHQLLLSPGSGSGSRFNSGSEADTSTVELLPIEHGHATSSALAVRQLLGDAIASGLLHALADVLRVALPSGPPGTSDGDAHAHARAVTVGLSQVLDIHRHALREGRVVLNQLPDEERQVAMIAEELGGASLGLFTRGIGGVEKRGEKTEMRCEVAAGCVWRSGTKEGEEAC